MGALDSLKASVGLAGIENARALSDELHEEWGTYNAAVTDKEKAAAAMAIANTKKALSDAVRVNRMRFKLIVNRT